MSRLRELIDELCPDGVEYKPLGEVGTFTKGRGLQKKDFSVTGVGCIHYGQIYTRLGSVAIEPLTYVSPEKAHGFTWVEPNDIVIAVTSENVDDVCKAVVWRGKDRIVTGAHAVVFHPFIDSMYVAYYLQTYCFNQQKIMIVDGVKVIEMKIDRLAKVRIPVPPIEVQREIVRILDSFQELDDALTAEIEAREKQYDDMRDRLMLDGNESSERPFKTFCTSMNTGPFGSSVHKSDYVDDGCPIVNPADIVGTRITVGKRVSAEAESRLIRYKLQKNDIVIGRRGEMGRIGIVDDASVGYLCGTGCFFVRMNDLALPGYWKHFFGTSYVKQYLDSHSVGGTMKNLNLNILGGMPVPVPNVDVQVPIVNHLDSIRSYIDCLRSAREARRKQFAYYRDKLLAFPEHPKEVDK